MLTEYFVANQKHAWARDILYKAIGGGRACVRAWYVKKKNNDPTIPDMQAVHYHNQARLAQPSKHLNVSAQPSKHLCSQWPPIDQHN
jgi:hypothetical protein